MQAERQTERQIQRKTARPGKSQKKRGHLRSKEQGDTGLQPTTNFSIDTAEGGGGPTHGTHKTCQHAASARVRHGKEEEAPGRDGCLERLHGITNAPIYTYSLTPAWVS